MLPMSEELRVTANHTEQVAYDSGEGCRAISHHRDNRYDPVSQPKLYAAYERGFADLDRKLSGDAR
jgi:hypothetical protein